MLAQTSSARQALFGGRRYGTLTNASGLLCTHTAVRKTAELSGTSVLACADALPHWSAHSARSRFFSPAANSISLAMRAFHQFVINSEAAQGGKEEKSLCTVCIDAENCVHRVS